MWTIQCFLPTTYSAEMLLVQLCRQEGKGTNRNSLTAN